MYYRKHELDDIKSWLEANYESSVKSVSFLLHADHNFPLPPYEEIDEAMYDRLMARVDMSVPLVNGPEGFDMLDDVACATGACPVR